MSLPPDEASTQITCKGIEEALAAGLNCWGDCDGQLLVLRALALTRVGALHADGLLGQAVAAARHAGVSWAAIGAELGVSKQAAQQRYASPSLPSLGRHQRLLKPVTALNEMKELESAGAQGWHSVSFGWLYHLLEASDQQWEHHRDGFPLPGNRKRLEANGWICVGTAFPWQYFKRPLGTPPLTDPEDPPSLESPGAGD